MDHRFLGATLNQASEQMIVNESLKLKSFIQNCAALFFWVVLKLPVN